MMELYQKVKMEGELDDDEDYEEYSRRWMSLSYPNKREIKTEKRQKGHQYMNQFQQLALQLQMYNQP